MFTNQSPSNYTYIRGIGSLCSTSQFTRKVRIAICIATIANSPIKKTRTPSSSMSGTATSSIRIVSLPNTSAATWKTGFSCNKKPKTCNYFYVKAISTVLLPNSDAVSRPLLSTVTVLALWMWMTLPLRRPLTRRSSTRHICQRP